MAKTGGKSWRRQGQGDAKKGLCVDQTGVRRGYTVRKKNLILRSIERRPQMQFSMARKFPLQRLRRYSVKHSKKLNFTLDVLWPRKTKEHRLGANQHPSDL